MSSDKIIGDLCDLDTNESRKDGSLPRLSDFNPQSYSELEDDLSETQSITSSASDLNSIERHGSILDKINKVRLKPTPDRAGSDRGSSSSMATISKLKSDVAILREALNSVNSLDIGLLQDKLRSSIAENKLLKLKNTDLRRRVMALEESLHSTNSQLQQLSLKSDSKPQTPVSRLKVKRSDIESFISVGNSEPSSSQLELELSRVREVVSTLSQQINDLKASSSQKDQMIASLRRRHGLRLPFPDVSEDPAATADPARSRSIAHSALEPSSAYALSLATSGTDITNSSSSKLTRAQSGPPEAALTTTDLLLGIEVSSSASKTLIERLDTYCQEQLKSARLSDARLIQILSDEIKSLTQSAQQNDSSFATTTTSHIISKGLVDAVELYPEAANGTDKEEEDDGSASKSPLPSVGPTRFSYGPLLISFLVGVFAMMISSGVVIWQLFRFNVIKR